MVYRAFREFRCVIGGRSWLTPRLTKLWICQAGPVRYRSVAARRSYFFNARDWPYFTGYLVFCVKNAGMDLIVAAKAFNQRALSQNWHQFCDPTLAFEYPAHAKLLSVWREKAGDRPMPTRSQITPRDLKDILRHVVLIQREQGDPSRYSWRLIGTSVSEIVGHHTGKHLDEHIPAEHLSRWTDSYDLILKSQKPWRFFGRVRIRERDYLDAEHLYVPLANDAGEPTYIMGLCHYTSHTSDSDNHWEDEIASIPGGLL